MRGATGDARRATTEPTWNPTFSTVSFDGTAIRIARNGQGPPLLLIHGLGANIEMWEPLVSHLPDRHVVMFDFPGTGASSPLPGYRRMSGLVRVVLKVLDECGLEHPDVLGYSWGGALAQQLAHDAPDRVRSLILAATTPGLGGQPPPPWAIAAMATPLRYYSTTHLRLVSPLIFGTTVQATESHVRARRAKPPSLRGYAQQLYAISGWSSRAWLRTVRTPSLVLAGNGDQLAPLRNAAILARSLPNATLRRLAGGHLFLLQQPTAAAQAISAFLDGPHRAQICQEDDQRCPTSGTAHA